MACGSSSQSRGQSLRASGFVEEVEGLVAQVEQHVPVAVDGLEADQEPLREDAWRRADVDELRCRDDGGLAQRPPTAVEQAAHEVPYRVGVEHIGQLIRADP